MKRVQNHLAAASAQLGRRYAPSAIDLAREAERADRNNRSEALQLANRLDSPPVDVVERAKIYLAFLNGDGEE